MKQLTKYGKKVKTKLIQIGMTQEQLISEIKEKMPDSYVDGSILNKIFIGAVKESAIIPVINEILGL